MKADYFWKPLFLILFLVSFFHLTIIPYSVWERNGRMLFLIPVLILIFAKGKLTKDSFIEPRLILWYFILIFINCLTCLYFREQSIWISLRGWQSFFYLLFVPVFYSWRLSIRQWEKILFSLFLIVLIGYFFQNIFIDANIFKLDKFRGFLAEESRIRIFSDGILFLGCIMSWNKYFINKHRYLLMLGIFSLLIIFLQGYRILIICILLVLFLMLRKIKGLHKGVFASLVIITLFGGFAQEIPLIKNKLDEIIQRSESASFDNESYVRVLDVEYTYNQHFINNYELFCGSGMTPLSLIIDQDSGDTNVGKKISDYSDYMSMLASRYHYFTIDMGILGLSWVAGIPFTILFIILLLNLYLRKMPNNYSYVSYYALFILSAGFTNAISYKHSNIIYISILLVLFDLIKKEEQEL